ncbi:hypothetical protein [Duncaniella sp.]|uniref:hypothetical protein n=1 Tax=Duncaniella sp. TaxID=2518496 RepID=UPI0023CDA7B7|nr:hypothetical protein [Duncaniella sp.]MDE5903991.1 hypothetical protein [Duncaniella sp.]
MKSEINNNSISQSEETQLLNSASAVIGGNVAGKNNVRKSGKGATIAAGAGGFAAGMAGGIGGTAVAATVDDAEIKADIENPDDVEPIAVPDKDDVILANNEGVRYAHVDADNFNDAFAQARAQVGPGGVFEYNGKLYGTYLADEWDKMTPQERADYQNRVNEIAPSHSAASDAAPATDVSGHHDASSAVVHTNAEMISAEPDDAEIRVLGVEAVQSEDGRIMNVALVECDGDQALLVDVDNNGTIDVMLHDDNGDGQIQESEIHDVSGAGLEVADLMQAQAAGEGDLLYASNDGMPDYVNDADSTMFV